MKKILLPLLLATTMLSSAASSPAGPKPTTRAAAPAAVVVYQLQPQLSTIGWVGKKVTGEHSGTIQFKSGQVLVKGSQITGGTFVVDMTTIKNTDLTDAEANGKLIGHLKSDDFYSVEKNPTATFIITGIKPRKGDASGNNATVTGNLTIKGKTNPLTFPAKMGVKNGVAAATGTATVDRTKYDIRFGSKSFFESLGDKAIDNNFTLTFNVLAKANGVASR